MRRGKSQKQQSHMRPYQDIIIIQRRNRKTHPHSRKNKTEEGKGNDGPCNLALIKHDREVLLVEIPSNGVSQEEVWRKAINFIDTRTSQLAVMIPWTHAIFRGCPIFTKRSSERMHRCVHFRPSGSKFRLSAGLKSICEWTCMYVHPPVNSDC